MARTQRRNVANKRSAAKGARRSKATKNKAASTKRAAAAAGAKRAKKKAAKKKAPAKKKAAAKKAPAKKKAAKKKAPAKKKATAKRKASKRKEHVAVSSTPKLKPLSARARKVGKAAVPPAAPSGPRNFGLRGAAPWVARHAAKHAEELRRRNAEPPPPGSARATLRVPKGAAQIKTKVAQLYQVTSKVRTLRKRLDKNFYEIGELLDSVQQSGIYEAKGFSTFESFLDREIDLPRSVSLRLIRITHTFHQETAYDFGLERLTSALAALDGELMQAPPSHPSSRGWSSPLPPKPPLRFDD